MTPTSVLDHTFDLRGIFPRGVREYTSSKDLQYFVDMGTGWPIITDKNYRWENRDRGN